MKRNYRRAVPEYTDQDRADFCELAKEIGIGRAIRELGFPTYPTAVSWLKARGIEPNVDKIMQDIKKYHTYYEVEDLLVTFDNGIAVAEEMIAKAESPDDLKRIADALYKLIQTRNLLEGKATQINEKRETTQQDLEIMELLSIEKAKNAEIEQEMADFPAGTPESNTNLGSKEENN